MAWQRIDDRMVEHPKIAPLNAGTKWAMIELWSYCSRNLTDGLVPSVAARRIATIRQLEDLVRARLFHEVVGGWVAHDWLDHNPSREEIVAQREKVAKRVRRHRERQTEQRS